MKKYIYKSDTSCFTSINIKGQLTPFSLYKNHEYELPENDAFVKSLVHQNLLKEKKIEELVVAEEKTEKKSFKKNK